MDKLLKPGRIIFATGIIGLSVLCFVYKDFIVGRPPAWPQKFDPNPALAYVSALLLMGAALTVLLYKKASPAAFFIAGLIFLLSVLRHLPFFMNDWGNTYKSIALVGGALIVGASFRMGTNLQKNLVVAGCICLAAFFISSGYAHFKFVGFVDNFIPAYIPFHSFWTYFCGICLIAGGIGIVIPQTRRLAALLSGIMVAGWFVLLHVPRVIANANDQSDRMGLFESFTFAGIFFVLAAISSPLKSVGE